MTDRTRQRSALRLYDAACTRSSAEIIHQYSTSFGIATRLLGSRHRHHVRSIYALVRVADELVDGVGVQAGLTPQDLLAHLDALAADTTSAIDSGYSANPIVHAFARTARASSIGGELVEPFFASMRNDIDASQDSHRDGDQVVYDTQAHHDYVYGSAAVIGLMCLRVFLRDEIRTPKEMHILDNGARALGAAFQNINFLRDLGDDAQRLGRSYLTVESRLSDQDKNYWLSRIRTDLATAQSSLALLPTDARTAVDCAHRLFSRLTDRLSHLTAEQLYTQRISVPAWEKALLITQTAAQSAKAAKK